MIPLIVAGAVVGAALLSDDDKKDTKSEDNKVQKRVVSEDYVRAKMREHERNIRRS